MRQFYLTYSIGQTLSEKFETTYSNPNLDFITPNPEIKSHELSFSKGRTVSDQFSLGWSHNLVLIRKNNPAERKFYEIELKEKLLQYKMLSKYRSESKRGIPFTTTLSELTSHLKK